MTTDADLLDLVVAQRTSTFRFDVVDVTLNALGQVYPVLACTIENNVDRTIKRTMSGLTLTPSDASLIDTFAHRIRPMMILENGSEWPLGVFLFADASRDRTTAGQMMMGTLVDQALVLDQGISASISLAAGTNVGAALATVILGGAGVSAYSIDATTQALNAALSWQVGTSRWKVLDDLAMLGGYLAPYFDNSGTLRFRIATDLSATPPTLGYEAGGRILNGSIVESDNLLDAPNRFLLIDTTAPAGAIVGVYDVPSSAPHSYAKRGFYVTKTIEAQGLTATSANDAAKAAGQRWAETYRRVTFASPPDPRHDTHDVVQYLGGLYREVSWSMPLVEGGDMRHEIVQVYT